MSVAVALNEAIQNTTCPEHHGTPAYLTPLTCRLSLPSSSLPLPLLLLLLLFFFFSSSLVLTSIALHLLSDHTLCRGVVY